MIGFSGVILFEAFLPRPLLSSRDWRFFLAFGLFVASGAALFSLMNLSIGGKKVMNLFSPDALYVPSSCLGMVWVTAFTEYKRINPSFDSYSSAVFGGLLSLDLPCRQNGRRFLGLLPSRRLSDRRRTSDGNFETKWRTFQISLHMLMGLALTLALCT